MSPLKPLRLPPLRRNLSKHPRQRPWKPQQAIRRPRRTMTPPSLQRATRRRFSPVSLALPMRRNPSTNRPPNCGARMRLLASQGRGSEVPTTHAPQAPTTYTQADVDARAREIADWNNYNRQANDLVGIGREKFGTWDESIDNLNGAGILSEPMLQRQIVEAALATGAAPDVINHLGQNLDEALRISQLPPARMGVELATLAGKLVKKAPAISSAPAPIGNATVHGSTQAPVDFAKLAAGDDMAAYVEARKKAGDPWANARSRR